MRGDGRTPRGLRAHQTTSHSVCGTTRSAAPTLTGRCAITKGRKNKQAKITSADVTTGRRIPQATSAAPTNKPSNIGRNHQQRSIQNYPNNNEHSNQETIQSRNKTCEQSTDFQQGRQNRRSKGGERFAAPTSKGSKTLVSQFKG